MRQLNAYDYRLLKSYKLQLLQARDFSFTETMAKSPLSHIFSHDNFNELVLFTAYFNKIPNFIIESYIDCIKAYDWFIKTYTSEIKDCYYSKRCKQNQKRAELDNVFLFLYNDLIVNFDMDDDNVRFFYRDTCIEKIEGIIDNLIKYKKRKKRGVPEIDLLVNTKHGINTTSLEISKPKLSIADNYNDDFLEIHQIILKRLLKKDDKGIVLLHGKPGTGKTSYIRYLVSSVKKQVIFLPPNMASAITNPDLMNTLIEHPNSIFVIEDAENIIMDREKKNYSPVSSLLNLADGLLSDCLNIQIICSFNTDISQIDKALMRKGRLIAKYEFKELTIEKGMHLSKKLGFNTVIREPMTLAQIYNQDEKGFHQVSAYTPIGFNNRSN